MGEEERGKHLERLVLAFVCIFLPPPSRSGSVVMNPNYPALLPHSEELAFFESPALSYLAPTDAAS